MRDPNQHVQEQLEYQLQSLLEVTPIQLSNSMTSQVVNSMGDGLIGFMVDYLNNGYGPMLDVDTACESCDYDSQHWTIKPFYFGTMFKEPPSQTIDKIFGYYTERIFAMQKHANETGHICEAVIHYFSIRLDIVPNIWSRLIRAMLVLRGLEYDAGSGYLWKGNKRVR